MGKATLNPTKHRILVIDDDIDLAHTLKEIFELEGALVDVACNGKEGIFLHTQLPYDIIISDLVMPVMDGLEVVMWIKENSPQTKLLVVSGGGLLDTKDYLQIAKQLGADFVMQKPIEFDSIQRVVRKLLTF